jgi:hypothetical protein
MKAKVFTLILGAGVAAGKGGLSRTGRVLKEVSFNSYHIPEVVL